MATTFLVLFPLGALSLCLPLRIATVRLIHAPIQILGLCLIIAGLGIGVTLAQNFHFLNHPVQQHVVIGITVVGTLVLFQPLMGLLQHLHFKKTGGKSVFAYLHRWLGRCMIILGMINGGLGLQLAMPGSIQAPNSAIIAYSVVAGVSAIIYLFAVLFRAARDISGTRGREGRGEGGRVEKYRMQNLNGTVDSGGRLIRGGGVVET
jgi:hypothetical protein